MRWFVYGQDVAVGDWVHERIPHAEFGPYVAIGLAEDNTLIAGVVYHNYVPRYGNIEISMAATTPPAPEPSKWKYSPATTSPPNKYPAWSMK